MKKLCIFTLLACSSLQAMDVLVEAKAAYYLPTSHKFRKIYHNGGGMYGLEATTQMWCDLYGFASGSFFYRSGSSLGEHHKTHITLVPIAAGLKYFFPLDCMDIYIGAGAIANWFHVVDNSPFVIHKTSKWAPGGIAKLGALFNYRSFFFDLFTDYTYIQQMHFHHTADHKVTRQSADVSGWSIGLGIGYRFGCRD